MLSWNKGSVPYAKSKNFVEQIFWDINTYIFQKDHVDLEHAYIDGTKIEANANRYTWVWKKSCLKNRNKVFEKISSLIDSMNADVLGSLGIRLEKREEYAIEYIKKILISYAAATDLDFAKFHNNPYRAENFSRNEEGNLICPNGKKLLFKYHKHVYKNKYDRTEELYECEDCSDCPHKAECLSEDGFIKKLLK